MINYFGRQFDINNYAKLKIINKLKYYIHQNIITINL